MTISKFLNCHTERSRSVKNQVQILLLSALFFVSCQHQECNTKDFKTGKFQFIQKINGKNDTTNFVRTDKFQIETYKGKTDTATVRWINDYEYIIQKLHPKNMEQQTKYSMKIISTKGKTYVFEYYDLNHPEKKQQGVVTKTE